MTIYITCCEDQLKLSGMTLMKRVNGLLAVLILCFTSTALAQTSGRKRIITRPAPGASCQLAGAYRIDVARSDKLYSVVKDAASSVPFGSQQQFFMDLSVRLTPPDLLAIECEGSRVSVASSRAPRVSFVADGRTRQEKKPDGGVVVSRVVMDRDTLTFKSQGKSDDNVNVDFKSMDGGRRLRVTRRIDAEQLMQPIMIQTFYDRIAEKVNWNSYSDDEVAKLPASPEKTSTVKVSRPGTMTEGAASNDAAVLRRSLEDWIDATNKRNIDRQMDFYMTRLKAFYLSRDTPRSAVHQEKRRVFQGVRSVEIRAEEPEIIFQDKGRTAVMRFNKKYKIAKNAGVRTGEVVQELRWQRTEDGWQIFSERDVRVIR